MSLARMPELSRAALALLLTLPACGGDGHGNPGQTIDGGGSPESDAGDPSAMDAGEGGDDDSMDSGRPEMDSGLPDMDSSTEPPMDADPPCTGCTCDASCAPEDDAQIESECMPFAGLWFRACTKPGGEKGIQDCTAQGVPYGECRTQDDLLDDAGLDDGGTRDAGTDAGGQKSCPGTLTCGVPSLPVGTGKFCIQDFGGLFSAPPLSTCTVQNAKCTDMGLNGVCGPQTQAGRMCIQTCE